MAAAARRAYALDGIRGPAGGSLPAGSAGVRPAGHLRHRYCRRRAAGTGRCDPAAGREVDPSRRRGPSPSAALDAGLLGADAGRRVGLIGAACGARVAATRPRGRSCGGGRRRERQGPRRRRSGGRSRDDGREAATQPRAARDGGRAGGLAERGAAESPYGLPFVRPHGLGGAGPQTVARRLAFSQQMTMVPAVGVRWSPVRPGPSRARDSAAGRPASAAGRPYFRVAGAPPGGSGSARSGPRSIGLPPRRQIWIDRASTREPAPAGGRSGRPTRRGRRRRAGRQLTPITLWVMKLRSPTIER